MDNQTHPLPSSPGVLSRNPTIRDHSHIITPQWSIVSTDEITGFHTCLKFSSLSFRVQQILQMNSSCYTDIHALKVDTSLPFHSSRMSLFAHIRPQDRRQACVPLFLRLFPQPNNHQHRVRVQLYIKKFWKKKIKTLKTKDSQQTLQSYGANLRLHVHVYHTLVKPQETYDANLPLYSAVCAIF